MTEMEQLKKNAENQLMMERFTSIFEWMEVVETEWDKEMIFARRNLHLTTAVIVVQLILSFILNSPFWIACFFLWLLLMMRQNRCNERMEYHKGRLFGAHKILFLLGMSNADIEDEMGKRKQRRKAFKVSPFKRFKEFFERMGAKNKQEAHG